MRTEIRNILIKHDVYSAKLAVDLFNYAEELLQVTPPMDLKKYTEDDVVNLAEYKLS